MNELVVRLAGPDDVAAVVALVESAYRGEASRAGWTTEADLLDGQRTDLEAVSRLVGPQSASSVLIGELVGAGIVGCCSIEPATAGRAYFGMFAVTPQRQAAGIGRRLLGASVMRMQVLRQRDELIAWYGRLGYLPTGETAPFPYGDDRFGRPRRDDLEFVVLERRIDA